MTLGDRSGLERREFEKQLREITLEDRGLTGGRENDSAGPSGYGSSAFWLSQIPHRGAPAFNPNPSGYKVFRNVRDYGAKGASSLPQIYVEFPR